MLQEPLLLLRQIALGLRLQHPQDIYRHLGLRQISLNFLCDGVDQFAHLLHRCTMKHRHNLYEKHLASLFLG